MTQPRALVIGGSVGGLFAAALLREIGWNVTVYERSRDDLAGRGAGVGVSQELLDIMTRIGVPLDPTIGAPIRSYLWLNRDSTIQHEMPRTIMSSTWGRIYAPLRASMSGADYRTGVALQRVEQDAKSITAVFADGSRDTADLLIAADGSLSTVRQQFLPDLQSRYAGYVAWRGLIDRQDIPASAREMITGHIVFSFPDGEMMLTMPAPGAGDDLSPGQQRCYFIWYRAATADELADICTDATGKRHGVSIPPPLIRPEAIAGLKSKAQAIFAPEVASVVAAAQQPLVQAISDLETPQLVFGRVAILGDAAFIARPHVAGGITKAALDAAQLVASLKTNPGDLPAALEIYDAAARDFGRKIVAHARYLGAYLEGPAGGTLARDPLQIMRDYGAPHLLHDPDLSTLDRVAS